MRLTVTTGIQNLKVEKKTKPKKGTIMSSDLCEVISPTSPAGPWNVNRASDISQSSSKDSKESKDSESSKVKTSRAPSDFSQMKKQLDFTIEDLEDAPGSDIISQQNEEMWDGLCTPKSE